MMVKHAAFAHITVPTDGSAIAEAGINIALDLAAPDGTLTFCNVVDPVPLAIAAAEGAAVYTDRMMETLEQDADVFGHLAQARASERGLKADVHVVHGPCIESLDDETRSNGTGAIVIGTHARTGLMRGMLGSVTDGLLRRVDVPVIAVHENDVMHDGPIAVAIDASPASRAALETAINVAKARNSSIFLIHVLERDEIDDFGSIPVMQEAKERAYDRGVPVHATVRTGDAAEKIVASAEAHHCAMIAIGTHGRGFLERMLLGSVAEAVVAGAHMPVIVVRDHRQ